MQRSNTAKTAPTPNSRANLQTPQKNRRKSPVPIMGTVDSSERAMKLEMISLPDPDC
jgi:hypothetical protein